MPGVYVFAETSDGAPKPVALELLTKARSLGTTTAIALGPGASQAADAFAEHGLEAIAHQVVSHPFAASYTEYFAKISARAISSLQVIPDEAFERGLAAFERHCRNTPDRPIYEPVEVFLFSATPR